MLAGIRLISLQKGHGSEQLGGLAQRFDVTDLGGHMGDLMDTAAAMKNLDLVVCVDSAPGPASPAPLGIPVWVALLFAADWRWLTDRDDNPWYPWMRLFRQERWGDWDDVFECIARQLKTDQGLRRIPVKQEDFDRLVVSIRQAGAIRRGEMEPSRTTELVPSAIKEIRKRFGISERPDGEPPSGGFQGPPAGA